MLQPKVLVGVLQTTAEGCENLDKTQTFWSTRIEIDQLLCVIYWIVSHSYIYIPKLVWHMQGPLAVT